MNKIHHVFVSSTYLDLIDERKKVSAAIAKAGFVPEGMEIFPASSQTQMDIIKKVIDRCDYYILIVAGKYGSTNSDGISFTEMEYNYALSRKIPILTFIYQDIQKLQNKDVESEKEKADKLGRFRKRVSEGALVDYWENGDHLATSALAALSQTKEMQPGVGWIRADQAASADLLSEINDLRKENINLKSAIENEIDDLPLPALPPPNSWLVVNLFPNSVPLKDGKKTGSHASVKVTWIDLFPIVYRGLKFETVQTDYGAFEDSIDTEASCLAIGSAIASDLIDFADTEDLFSISPQVLNKLIDFYIETDLMMEGEPPSFTTAARRWARRHGILSLDEVQFELVKGKIEITQEKDEIPSKTS